jgi:aryl-phospho-beta-D-glucosidase BglC (GH1 family)
MQDTYDILTGHGIGWALWNFRGTFGILNSGRDDVAYEDWYGLKLDRKMLELLRAH